MTPLHWTAEFGHTDLARLLIENSAEVNTWDNVDWTPPHCAAQSGHTDATRLLIEKGADINALFGHLAIQATARLRAPLRSVGLPTATKPFAQTGGRTSAYLSEARQLPNVVRSHVVTATDRSLLRPRRIPE